MKQLGREGASAADSNLGIEEADQRSDRHERRVVSALALVVVVYVALASFVALRTPSFESADENGHIDNIEAFASGHWYRIPSRCWTRDFKRYFCHNNELHQPPLYYLLMAGWQDALGLSPISPALSLGAAPGAVGGHDEVLQRHPDRGLVLWLRIPNIALGAATVLMAFLAGRRVARDQWTPVVAAALVALFPRFVFLSPFVTNDNLVTFLGAVLTWCALRFTERPSWGRMAAVGGIFGLLITTKLSVFPVGLLLLALPIAASPWARRLWLALTGVLAALVVSGWYLVQNWVRYGDPLARHASKNYLMQIGGLGTPLFTPYVVKDPLHLVFVDVPHLFAIDFWYTSGWGQFHWSKTVGIVLAAVVGFLLLGLIGQHIRTRVLLTLGIITVLSFACVWFVAFQTATYQPRYALVGLAAMAVLVALALQRWPLWTRWLLPAAALIGCLVAIRLDVIGVHWT